MRPMSNGVIGPDNFPFFSRPQYHRIHRILELIRQGTRTGVLPNATSFRRELGVSWRTAIRDLDFLRDELQAPIEYDASRKGFRLRDAAWQLQPVRLSRREIFAFSLARKLLDRFRGTALDLDMHSVLRKIADSLEGQVTVDLDALTDRFTVLGEDYVPQDPRIWNAVARCVERREGMRVVYQKFNGEVKTYELEPLHLVSYHGNWYALARRPDNGPVRTFAVSRFRAIEGTGQFFAPPQDFDVQRHLAKSFGIVRGEDVMRVRLRFSPAVAAYIRERVWHATQKVVEKRDGGVELSFETAGWKELVRWVLSWQPDVTVLSPKRLRERVEEKMRQGLGIRGDLKPSGARSQRQTASPE